MRDNIFECLYHRSLRHFLGIPMFVLTPEQRQDIAYILSLKTNK